MIYYYVDEEMDDAVQWFPIKPNVYIVNSLFLDDFLKTYSNRRSNGRG